MTTQAQSNVSNVVNEQSVQVTEKVKTHAAAVRAALDGMAESEGGLYRVVIGARLDGVTFAEMEAADATLQKTTAYRTAKSTVTAAEKHGVALVAADGTTRGKKALSDATKAAPTYVPKARGTKQTKAQGAADGAQAETRKATPAEVIAMALALLNDAKDGRALRKQFVQDLRPVVHMANDEETADIQAAKAEDARKAKEAEAAKLTNAQRKAARKAEREALKRQAEADAAALAAEAAALAGQRTVSPAEAEALGVHVELEGAEA